MPPEQTGDIRISDLGDHIDARVLDPALRGGGLRAQPVVDPFATGAGAATLLDFGNGTTIVVEGIANPGLLVSGIIISSPSRRRRASGNARRLCPRARKGSTDRLGPC